MSRPHRIEEIINDVMQKLPYDTEELQQRPTEFVPRFNSEQKKVFDSVLQQSESEEGWLVFQNAPGGTWKSFLLNLLKLAYKFEKTKNLLTQ
ncbi:hypothetical protein AVEN_216038-1 [Araneus ventricosus]|uniref:ATP-dependent DNA helicase n=1 Tax=Araneus ventricosus TaxID=182803 RepID=A0A4Y2HUZ1_ARAVE|nr:hypothetical protein AVEN_216038-1 [Araneus ventricosus]